MAAEPLTSPSTIVPFVIIADVTALYATSVPSEASTVFALPIAKAAGSPLASP